MLEPSKGRTKISGRYRIKEPIENFRIRVKIVQQKSLLAELFENEDETLDSNFLEDEEYEFGWQEKVLGPYEANYYREERNCVTEQQKQYHQRLLELGESEAGYRLYSYVKADAYYPDPNPITGKYRSSLSVKNEQALPAVRNRKPFSERYNKQVVDEDPSDKRIRQNHYLYTERENMYIVVDLSPKDKGSTTGTTDSETLLCALSYDPLHRCLTVNPDFSSKECYSVEGIGMSYDFWIEHASPRPSARELLGRREAAKKELERLRGLKESRLYHEVRSPQPRVLRLRLGLDIGSARDFEQEDGLFVSYWLELPRHWRAAGESDRRRLAGRTQRCRARERRAHFSYCTDLLLDLDLAGLAAERDARPDGVELATWPTILISVASLDAWTRYRIEGYGSLGLPVEPGCYSLSLNTWRPAGGLVDSLRRFFTGGTCELEDITYCAVPAAHEGRLLDKAKLRAIPSGSVDLRLSLVHQSQSYAAHRELEAIVGAGGAGLGQAGLLHAGKLLSSVNDVLSQFKAARERMIQARAMCS